MRLQLALNVRDLDDATAYYAKMFDTAPHKTRPGYANFEIEDPALKLVLFENPNADQELNHLGVEMFEGADVARTSERFAAAGILKSVQEDSVCCFAGQDKVWTDGGDELNWEWYIINDDNPDGDGNRDAGSCCGELREDNRACC